MVGCHDKRHRGDRKIGSRAAADIGRVARELDGEAAGIDAGMQAVEAEVGETGRAAGVGGCAPRNVPLIKKRRTSLASG